MAAQPPQTARILVVDDEEANVRLLERLLAQAGYTNVHGLTDPRQAAARFAELEPDLVLLDLRMPHRDGFQVLDDLRLLIPEGSYLPILVLTADVTADALRRALLAGANDFLTKPFDAQEVMLRIRNLLQTRFLHLAVQYQNRVLEERVEERTRQVVQMEKLSAMGQLLAGVAHELNNPLTVVSGQALLLQAVPEGPSAAVRAAKIQAAADRCVRIVRNFLALAREHPPERTQVDLNTVVREAVELLGYELRTESIEIVMAPDPDLPILWADPHELHQVAVNLMTNAQHAMRRMPLRRLTLTTRAGADGGVQLVVSDTGPGIPSEIRDRIFDPFFTTKPPGQGTGLGLSMVLGIIRDHEGSVRVESAPGEGSTFTVDLPVGAARAVVPARAASVAGPARPAAGQRILVVDDEPDVAEVLVEILQTEGYTVDRAGNGAEALDQLARHGYEAVLSDTKMPILDGLEFYAEVQRRYPALVSRIAFITGDVLNAEKRALLTQAGVPMVAKPFQPGQIAAVVRQLLER